MTSFFVLLVTQCHVIWFICLPFLCRDMAQNDECVVFGVGMLNLAFLTTSILLTVFIGASNKCVDSTIAVLFKMMAKWLFFFFV